MAKALNLGGMGGGNGIFQRGRGGILPERGSQQQLQMVMQALQGANNTAMQSGSPLLALLAPMAAGAIGSRTQGQYADAQAGRDSSAIDVLIETMGRTGSGGAGGLPGFLPSPQAGVPSTKGGGPDASAAIRAAMVPPSVPQEPLSYGAYADDFDTSLSRTESGGRYDIANGEGFVGKYQFGQARLDDFNRANGTSYTTADLKGNTPEKRALQEQVQDWHVADIDKFLTAKGIDRALGTEIGGTPVTLNGLRAVAHLGGKGGMEKFVNSGGQYNPADSNGTSLSDYLATHAGGGSTSKSAMTAGGATGPSRELLEILVQPGVSEPLRDLASTLIAGRMGGGMSPMEQLEYRKAQADLMKALQPDRVDPVRVGDALVNPLTGQPVYTAPQPPERVDPVEVDGALVNPATGEVVYEAPEGKRSRAGRGELAKQYNQAVKLLQDAIKFERDVNGLDEQEARQKVLGDPLYRRQLELLQLAAKKLEGAGETPPGNALGAPPPPPPGTVPF